MNLKTFTWACAVAAVALPVSFAQDTAPPKEATAFYKFDFVVKELDGGKVLNARNYSAIVSDHASGKRCSIRTGSKVPINSGGASYADVGVNIDCFDVTKVDQQNELTMRVAAAVSSLAPDTVPQGNPVIRQNSWESSVVIHLDKPTLLFSSDDVSTKHQIQLELTAREIK